MIEAKLREMTAEGSRVEQDSTQDQKVSRMPKGTGGIKGRGYKEVRDLDRVPDGS